MNKQFFSSNLFLNIVRVSIVFAGMFFMGDGCKKDNPVAHNEEQKSPYLGRWKLINTDDADSLKLTNNQWLTLNEDFSFNCTSSFFWRSDSLKFIPLNGKWGTYKVVMDASKGVVWEYMYFAVDSVQKDWLIYGWYGTKTFMLYSRSPASVWSPYYN